MLRDIVSGLFFRIGKLSQYYEENWNALVQKDYN